MIFFLQRIQTLLFSIQFEDYYSFRGICHLRKATFVFQSLPIPTKSILAKDNSIFFHCFPNEQIKKYNTTDHNSNPTDFSLSLSLLLSFFNFFTFSNIYFSFSLGHVRTQIHYRTFVQKTFLSHSQDVLFLVHSFEKNSSCK